MEKIDYKKILDDMSVHGVKTTPPINFRVPGSVTAVYDAMEYFIGPKFEWLSEYGQVAEWLTNNRGLGLCLYGNNGTGKTILVQRVIPLLLFHHCRKIIKCFNYYDLNTKTDSITSMRLISIDDVGVESEGVVYGNKRWVFPEIMDIAEKCGNIVIFSSNLDAKGFCDKYGIRTFERIVATTKRIKFTHKSFRK